MLAQGLKYPDFQCAGALEYKEDAEPHSFWTLLIFILYMFRKHEVDQT